jgi:hypothetical protein
MSTTMAAPTSFAISANWSKFRVRGYALAPTTRTFGLCSRARVRTSAMSMVSDSLARPYGTILKSLPEKFTGEPCVRCPPKLRLIARRVSPGFASAKYAAMLACDPECGCTLAWSALKSFRAWSMASCST